MVAAISGRHFCTANATVASSSFITRHISRVDIVSIFIVLGFRPSVWRAERSNVAMLQTTSSFSFLRFNSLVLGEILRECVDFEVRNFE